MRRTRRPPASSVPTAAPAATARARSTSASDGGWPPPPASRSQRRRARRASGRGAPRHRPGVGRVGQRVGAPATRAAPPRRAARRPGGPAAAPGRGPATSAHSGSSSWRTRLRTKAGSSLLASHTGARPAAAHTAWVSVRRRPSSGCRGPGSMPARPSAPAPRSRLTRIVSAWSSMVCPVATPAGSTAKRAARARASRLGPGATDDRGGLEARPEARRPPPPRPRPPRPSPGRRPWSTWMAVTSHPAAAASTRRASESAPPETAQASGGARRREGAAGQQVGDEGGGTGRAAPCRSRHRPGPPRRPGSRISSRVGSHSGPSQTRASSAGPPAASTDSTKRSPSAYWRILASRPSSFDISLVSPRAWVRRSWSTWEKCAAPGTSAAPARSIVTSPWPSSRLIIPEILDSASRCSGVASMPTTPASRAGLRPVRTSSATRRTMSAKPAGSPESGPSSSETRPTKWSRSQGTAVNCSRCVTSCSASHSRNWLGAKPYCSSTATMFGPDVGDEVLVLG